MTDRDARAHGELLAAYARTHVEFRDPASGVPCVLCPAPLGTVGRWPFAGVAIVPVVTAWHPRSDPRRDPSRNRADQEELRRSIEGDGFAAIDCVGVGPATDAAAAATHDTGGAACATASGRWAEPSLLVPGAPRALARRWAAHFAQNAIYVWTPTEWRVVGVLLEMDDVVLGWCLSPARR